MVIISMCAIHFVFAMEHENSLDKGVRLNLLILVLCVQCEQLLRGIIFFHVLDATFVKYIFFIHHNNA